MRSASVISPLCFKDPSRMSRSNWRPSRRQAWLPTAEIASGSIIALLMTALESCFRRFPL